MVQPSEGILFLKIRALKYLSTKLDSERNKIGFRLLFYRKLQGILEYEKGIYTREKSLDELIQQLEQIVNKRLIKHHSGQWLSIRETFFWIIIVMVLLILGTVFFQLPGFVTAIAIICAIYATVLIGFRKQSSVLEEMAKGYQHIAHNIKWPEQNNERLLVKSPRKHHIIFNLYEKEKVLKSTVIGVIKTISFLDAAITIPLTAGFAHFIFFAEVSIPGISRSLLITLIVFLLVVIYNVIAALRNQRKNASRMDNNCILFYNPVKDISVRPIFWQEHLHKIDEKDLTQYFICEMTKQDALQIQTNKINPDDIGSFLRRRAIHLLESSYFSGLVAKETATGLTMFNSSEYYIPSVEDPMIFPKDLKCYEDLKELFHYCGWL